MPAYCVRYQSYIALIHSFYTLSNGVVCNALLYRASTHFEQRLCQYGTYLYCSTTTIYRGKRVPNHSKWNMMKKKEVPSYNARLDADDLGPLLRSSSFLLALSLQ